ncbi:hypothetical protein P692DRAFT_20823135 [Suillus brevipes Sb2]|nr:hypothetical protein P692DRAFT_20823135 [Suillus brevipes Sb2]
MEPQNVSCYFFGATHPTFLPLAGGIIGRSEAFHFTGYLAIPPQPVLYPLYVDVGCLTFGRSASLKLKITLLDYVMTSIKNHCPAYEPDQQGKEVPIYVDCGISEMTLDWDIAWYKQGPNKVHRVYRWFSSDPGKYSPLHQETAANIPEMVEPPILHYKQPSVMPGVYLSTPQSPAGSSANLYSPVPESCMMSSAMDASSIQVDDDTAQSTVQEAAPFTDTLHTILVGLPRWRSTLVCLRLKMKVAVCCGNAQNPFLLTQPGYTEQKTQFIDELFDQSLTAVNMTRDDLEKVVSIDGVTTITPDEMLALASKWLAGFISDLKRMAKLAIMDTRSAFGFGLHDTSAADPSLLANKCVELLMRFIAPQSTSLPISANGIMKLLKYEIVKSLVFYVVFRPSSTSGARVIIGDEEPAIFRTATLPPVWMVAFVLATWYSALLTRLSELVKAMRTSGLPINIMLSIFPPVPQIYTEVLQHLLWLLGQTDDPAYPDLLQVLAGLCDISRLITANAIVWGWGFCKCKCKLTLENRTATASGLAVKINPLHDSVPDTLFATTFVLFGWVDALDLIAVLQTQLVQEADENLVTSQVTQQVDVDISPVDCDQHELSSATREKCEAWLATSWQFEVDFPQAHEVPELYEHLSRGRGLLLELLEHLNHVYLPTLPNCLIIGLKIGVRPHPYRMFLRSPDNLTCCN